MLLVGSRNQVVFTDHQQKWQTHLEQIGLDPELFRYQLAMNQREGAADEVFRFRRDADFVRFLFELAFDPRTADQIAGNLQAQRDNLRERPRWELERAFVGEGLPHMRPLAPHVPYGSHVRRREMGAMTRRPQEAEQLRRRRLRLARTLRSGRVCAFEFDASVLDSGVDEAQGLLRVMAQDWATDSVELVVYDTSDWSRVGALQLGQDAFPSYTFEPDRVRVVIGRQLLTAVSSLADVSLLPETIELPGARGRLHSDELGAALLIEALDNPGGGTRLALSAVDTEAGVVGERLEIEGDWVFSGAPVVDRSVNGQPARIALPIDRTWWQPPGVCPDTETDYGVQLIERSGGSLTLRGFIALDSEVKSIAWHDGQFHVRTTERDEVFDVSDVDTPIQRAGVGTTVSADRVVTAGDVIARLHTDNYNTQILELVSADAPALSDPISRLVLADPGPLDWDPCESQSHWTESMLVAGDHLFVSRFHYLAGPGDAVRAVSIIDISDPAAPREVAEFVLPTRGSGPSLDLDGETVQTSIVGDALVVATRGDVEYLYPGEGRLMIPQASAQFHVFDISNPGAPTLVQVFDRAPGMTYGDLLVEDGAIVSWMATAANEDASWMHIFVEKLDLSNPSAPLLSQPLSVPGVPLAGASDGNMLVVDQRILGASLSRDDCDANGYAWDEASAACKDEHPVLAKIEVERDVAEVVWGADLPGDRQPRRFGRVAGRAFAVRGDAAQSSVTAVDWGGDAPSVGADLPLPVGAFPQLHAVGERLLGTWAGGYVVLDASSDPGTIEVRERLPSGCVAADALSPSVALCAMGRWGVETLEL